MPTYHFRCPKGHDTERFYKTMSGAPMELECPECGASAARQLSGGAGLVFKGSGFYLTDYGKNAHRGTGPEKKPDSASAGSGKSETTSKPESSGGDTTKPKAESVKPKPKSE